MAKSKRITATDESTGVPRDTISMRAYEKWLQRGMPHGSDQQDWYEAEAELRTQKAKKPDTPPTRPAR